MSQDSKVFFRIFLGIGLVLILISVVIFYNQFTYSKDAIHTEGVIVDTVWHSSHSHRTGKNGSWYPVVAFRPTPDYTLIFNSSIGSDFYEDSEGDKVNVTREIDGGSQTVSLSLPAVITTDLRLNEPRYAKLPNIMKAKKKQLDETSPADYGVDMTSKQQITKVVPPAERKAGITVKSVDELIDKLRNEAKVI